MNFTYIGKTDITSTLEKFNSDIADWTLEKFRQNVYSAHENTESLPLRWSVEAMTLGTPPTDNEVLFNHFEMDSFFNQIYPLYEAAFGKGTFYRAVLVKLKANTQVHAHKDSGESLVKDRRTHIPVITNPETIFTVGGEKKHMKVGEIWMIDNTVIHSVENFTDTDRIHFIIDYRPEGKKTLF